MRWLRRARNAEPGPEEPDAEMIPYTTTADIDQKVADADRQLEEARVRSAHARTIAAESARLVARNSIASLIRDSIVSPGSE